MTLKCEKNRASASVSWYRGRTTALTFATDNVAVRAYSKLLLHALRPYLVTSPTSHIITIHQDRIPNRKSSDWASLEPPLYMHQQYDTVNIEHSQSSPRASVILPGDRNDQQEQDKRNAIYTKELTVDHIANHVDNGPQNKYMVR